MKYAERVEKVKHFVDRNKLFTLISVIVLIYLCSNFVFSKVNPDFHTDETIQTATENDTTEEDSPHWQFYWSDLYILIGAGGFCTVMMIREKKKGREEL